MKSWRKCNGNGLVHSVERRVEEKKGEKGGVKWGEERKAERNGERTTQNSYFLLNPSHVQQHPHIRQSELNLAYIFQFQKHTINFQIDYDKVIFFN